MAYGDGSLFENERGTWTGFKTIDGKRYKRTAATKTAVRAAFKELERQVAAGGPASTGRATVADVVAIWIESDLAGRGSAPSTVSRHRWAAEHIAKHLGDKRAATLKVAHVEKMLNDLAAGGLGRASLVKIRNTLSQSLHFGVRRELVPRDVARYALIPASAPRTRPRRSLTPDNARTLLSALRGERNGLAYALSLRLGLRPGEAWAIHWEDVADGAVNVTRGLQRKGGAVNIVDELKTASSKRTLSLPDDMIDWFDDHRNRQRDERASAERWDDPTLVFTTKHGSLVMPSVARRRLIRLCEIARIQAISPNELRHACASLLADQGVPNESIADLLGHTTTRMVDSTYTHRLRPTIDVAATATWVHPQ